ncbi:NACHT domain-containing protein [Actinospica durhamensis]|uniref:NACHT domain-containing protein n=1 Tax=Actinospica durhamensis TaxID=1508375 RepID=A0A941ETE9_9ACTN|nr:NACHT domain-containing protein [Actinospica durhamensis]MBR7836706.1 NACHT domain-containing protein [Actinospica durhamensis]
MLGIVVTILVALVTPVRRTLIRFVDWISFRLGIPARRYRRGFNERYRLLENVYLNKKERLDLGGTYVALSAVGGTADPQNRTIATTVLAERDNRRLIITGAPGSGKSTLLKAYAVGTTRSGKRLEGSADLLKIDHSKEIPFFVQLRRVAGTVWDHLVEEILVSDFGFQKPQAEKFLRRLLDRSRCLILLDGLDEVPDERYQEVRGAILHFIGDQNPDRSTANARTVLTCRRQNFKPEEWTTFSDVEHVLTPMQNSEILSYLKNRRADFTERGLTPERFFTAIESSATFDLHRTPLVLTMSIGLYLERQIDAVPNSISALYEAMIRTMLDRHKFIPEGRPVNVFTQDDKERFLQSFALAMAERRHVFQDFSAEELLAVATRLAPHLGRVRPDQAQALVDEIVNRSGLLSQIAPGFYTFAHRSIQEYLIAAQLRDREPNGVDRLLARTFDHEWQQVVLFFAAGHTAVVEEFVAKLYLLDRELAIRCLANVATQNVNVMAQRMLTEFTQETLAATDFDAAVPTRLAAILYACRAVPEPVRDVAVACADQLLHRIEVAQFASVVGGDDNLLRVLRELVATNATKVASLVPELAESIPDDPRLVPVLWRCLNVLDHEAFPDECRRLISRLMVMAMEASCFEELEDQPRLRSAAITDGLRRRAYPFVDALQVAESNLVTLLAWAELMDVVPEKKNLFLQAKGAGPRYFDNLERDNRRTIRFGFHRPALVFSTLVSAVSTCVVIWTATRRPHAFLEPYGWWNVVLVTLATVIGGGLTIVVIFYLPHFKVADDDPGQPGLWVGVLSIEAMPDIVLFLIAFGLFPGTISLSLVELLRQSIWVFLVVASAAVFFGYGIFITRVFRSDAVYTFNKRNRFVDAYTDPSSAHWLSSVPAAEHTPEVSVPSPAES